MKFKLLRIAFTLVNLSFFTGLSAQQGEKLPGRNTPIYTNLEENGVVIPIEGAVDKLRSYFNIDQRYSFKLINSFKDDIGYTHYRYRQYSQDIPVEGSMWIIHEKGNVVQSVNGDVFDIKSSRKTPSITEEVALRAAMGALPATQYMWQLSKAQLGDDSVLFSASPKGELVYVPEEGAFGVSPFRLAYKFDIYSAEPLQRAYVFVDAEDGHPLWQVSRIQDISVSGTGGTLYSGTKSFMVDSLAVGSYRLFDDTRGKGVHTKDMNSGTSGTGSEETNTSPNYTSATNSVKAIYDAHWGGAMAYDYFRDSFNRYSYDDDTSLILLRTRYSSSYDNAFWDGSRLTFGSGNTFSPLTALEVVGHELTHGVTEYTAGLFYNGEPGALNESFSDIFGHSIEIIHKPAATWVVGEEIVTGGLRDMSNPNANGDPDTYQGTNWISTNYDNYGVHINSGVQNYWYYLTSVGGSGTNDNGDAFSVTGIGESEASRIAYRNLSVYLTPTSDYAVARQFAIQSARDLYSSCSNEVAQVTNAWYAVGVGDSVATSGASFTNTSTTTCTNYVTADFDNTSGSVQSSMWYFGDNTTSTANNPTHSYTQPGTYNVKLVVTHCNNLKDSVTVNAAVTVTGAAGICDTIEMDQPVKGSSFCKAIITDDGGANGDYSNSNYSALYFNDPAVTQYKINFLSFSLENGFDYLYLYDGPTDNSPLIGFYTGSSLPFSGTTYTTTSNELLVVFYSDNLVDDAGFVAKIECLSPLPVRLLTWSATAGDCNTRLSWKVADVKDFDHFELEKGTDGIHFSKIVTQAIHSQNTNYDFIDHNTGEEGPLYYRLKLVDLNGSFTYSKVLSILPNCTGRSLVDISPNPATGKVVVTSSELIGNISIVSATGQLIREVSGNGTASVEVDISGIANGVYMMQIQQASGLKQYKKLIKQ